MSNAPRSAIAAAMLITTIVRANALEPLVSAQTLHQLQSNSDIRIIEICHEKEQFAAGHIPGAASADWIDDLTDPSNRDRYTRPPKADIERLLSSIGVTPVTPIVLYDDLGSRLSTRMYWTLKVYGHKSVHILNGGKAAWTNAGFHWSTDQPEFQTTKYVASAVETDIEIKASAIARQLKSPKVTIIDGRPQSQFTGEEPGKVFHTNVAHNRRGHIPGAVNIYWTDNFNSDGTFKSVNELRSLYEANDVTSDKAVVTYCNEGIHAAPPWFVLQELLGYENVRLYDDSMAEWANEPKFPLSSLNARR